MTPNYGPEPTKLHSPHGTRAKDHWWSSFFPRANYRNYHHPKSKPWLVHLTLLLVVFAVVSGGTVFIERPDDASHLKSDDGEGSGDADAKFQSKRVFANSTTTTSPSPLNSDKFAAGGRSDSVLESEGKVYISLISGGNISSINSSISPTFSTVPPIKGGYRSKFTIEELLHRRFDHRISNDIYMDPCKAGEL